MSKMELEQLNGKLTEWVGCDEVRVSRTPFPESLDACFAWLVPKLQGLNKPYGVGIQIDCMGGSQDWYCHLNSVRTPIPKGKDILDRRFGVYAVDKTPALALCRAILKLIDGDKVK